MIRKWFSGVFRPDEIETDSVDTDDLDIGGSDFVSQGEVVPVAMFNGVSGRSESTTSTSYANMLTFGIWRLQWDKIAPAGATTAVAMSYSAVPGTDETLDVRVQNTDDGETIIEETGAAGSSWTGWQTYSPTTTASIISPRSQQRTNPGSNSSKIEDLSFWVGIQL